MMRKFVLIAATAAAIATVVSTASAQVVHKFTVVDISTSHRPGPNDSTITPGVLVRPGTRNQVVGHDLVKFTPRGDKLRVRAVFFFATGKIKAKGLVGPGDDKLAILGGTRAFDGASGKLLVHRTNGRGTPLTFVIVQ